MPTNPFQRLAYRIQKALHDPSVEVEESVYVDNCVAGGKDEIDVLITFKQGSYTYRTAVACRDHKRKAGKEWIRYLASQRLECRLDKMIAVHSCGFSASAKTLADTYNIPCLKPDYSDATSRPKPDGYPSDNIVGHVVDVSPVPGGVYLETVPALPNDTNPEDLVYLFPAGGEIAASKLAHLHDDVLKSLLLRQIEADSRLHLAITGPNVTPPLFDIEVFRRLLIRLDHGTKVRTKDGSIVEMKSFEGVFRLRMARVHYQADARMQVGDSKVSTSARPLFGGTSHLTLTKTGDKNGLHLDLEGTGQVNMPVPGKEVALPDWMTSAIHFAILEVVDKPDEFQPGRGFPPR